MVASAATDVASEGVWYCMALVAFRQLNGHEAFHLAIDPAGAVFDERVNGPRAGLGVSRFTEAAGCREREAAHASLRLRTTLDLWVAIHHV